MTSIVLTQEPHRSPSRPVSSHGGQGEPSVEFSLESHSKDIRHDCPQHIQIEAWENEGGAHTSEPLAVSGRNDLDQASFLTTHIETAEHLLAYGRYEEACLELKAAADRFAAYRARIEHSFDTSIARLTTMGCRATPPDPRALKLIRLRQQLSA